MKLVTVATYYESTQARIALNMLHSEGVNAVLENEAFLQNIWWLGEVVGQIPLKVAECDVEQACSILQQKPTVDLTELKRLAMEARPQEDEAPALLKRFYADSDEDEIEEDLSGAVDAEDDGDGLDDTVAESDLNARELLVNRACRGSLVTILFMPLALIVTYILFRIMLSEQPLRPKYRKRLIWACLLHAPSLLIILLVIRSIVHSMF